VNTISYNLQLCRLRFDHHQLDFGETFSKDHSAKLSSVGLIMKHYGTRIVGELYKQRYEAKANGYEMIRTSLSPDQIAAILDLWYTNTIQEIDATDNGEATGPKSYMYDKGSNIYTRIAHLNRGRGEAANIKKSMYPDTADYEMALFEVACRVMTTYLVMTFDRWVAHHFNIKDLLACLADPTRHEFSFDKRLCIFPHNPTFEEYIDSIEAFKDVQIIATHNVGKNTYRIRCVPEYFTSFKTKCCIPEEFRGKEGSSIGLEFGHANGFMAVTLPGRRDAITTVAEKIFGISDSQGNLQADNGKRKGKGRGSNRSGK